MSAPVFALFTVLCEVVAARESHIHEGQLVFHTTGLVALQPNGLLLADILYAQTSTWVLLYSQVGRRPHTTAVCNEMSRVGRANYAQNKWRLNWVKVFQMFPNIGVSRLGWECEVAGSHSRHNPRPKSSHCYCSPVQSELLGLSAERKA